MSRPSIPGGYILLSRKIIESQIWDKPPLYIKVWIWLLSKAQHNEYKGLSRGEYYTKIADIQEAMSWRVGYRKETPTYKQIRDILDWLRNPYEGSHEGRTKGTTKVSTMGSMIVTTKGTQGMLVKIVNYDHYQNPQNYEGHSESHNEGHNERITNELRRSSQGHNINKNDNKNVKNNNINNSSSQNKFSEADIEYRLSKKLKELILSNNPGAKVPDNLQKWSLDFDRMIRLDKRDPTDIFKVIEFSQEDPFWQSNILSAAKLRKQYDTLYMQMKRRPVSNKGSPKQGFDLEEYIRKHKGDDGFG